VNTELGYAMAYACWHRGAWGPLECVRREYVRSCHADFSHLQFLRRLRQLNELPF
jgi:hypothetical protein